MKVRELRTILFTEYPGHLGFGPAVITLAVCVAVAASIVYGGVKLGKAVLANAPTVQTGQT